MKIAYGKTLTRAVLAGAALACLALILSSPASASPAKLREYPQFRYIGGLPGNGWAVDSEGKAGFDGAMSQTIPLGYTPSHGSFAAAYHAGSIRGGPQLGFEGRDVNGMIAGSMGFGSPGHGLCLTIDAVDDKWDMAINLQGQILKETDSRPAVSVGVLDFLNAREAMAGVPPGDPGARSYYVAATKRLDAGGRPLHVTAGFGTDRFNDRPFVGASYDVHRRLKVMAEYDGFNTNAAIAAQLLPDKRRRGIYKDRPRPRRRDALILFLGAADLDRPVMGFSYTR